nr:centromere protein X [Ipomoea batatas]
METDKNSTFDPDLVHEIFKLVWRRRAAGLAFYLFLYIISLRIPLSRLTLTNFPADREKNDLPQTMDTEIVGAASASRKNRPTFANATALKLSCELLRVFVAEAVQRAAVIAEAEDLEIRILSLPKD